MFPLCRTVRVILLMALFDSFMTASCSGALVFHCLPLEAVEPNMEHIHEKHARAATARLAPPTAPRAEGCR